MKKICSKFGNVGEMTEFMRGLDGVGKVDSRCDWLMVCEITGLAFFKEMPEMLDSKVNYQQILAECAALLLGVM